MISEMISDIARAQEHWDKLKKKMQQLQRQGDEKLFEKLIGRARKLIGRARRVWPDKFGQDSGGMEGGKEDCLNQVEYAFLMLIQIGELDESASDIYIKQFKKFDSDNSGKLTQQVVC